MACIYVCWKKKQVATCHHPVRERGDTVEVFTRHGSYFPLALAERPEVIRTVGGDVFVEITEWCP